MAVGVHIGEGQDGLGLARVGVEGSNVGCEVSVMAEEQVEQPDEDSAGESGTGTAVIPSKTKPKPKPTPSLLPPFKVLLHDDPVNDMLHVVETILELTPLTAEESVERMLEAHHSGVALLLMTHRERAELYCEQFATFKLTVTTEPD